MARNSVSFSTRHRTSLYPTNDEESKQIRIRGRDRLFKIGVIQSVLGGTAILVGILSLVYGVPTGSFPFFLGAPMWCGVMVVCAGLVGILGSRQRDTNDGSATGRQRCFDKETATLRCNLEKDTSQHLTIHLGGGIAVGSVVLLEEDMYGSYSKLLLKYFLAEGVMCAHYLHVSSAHVTPANLLQELPGPVLDEPDPQQVPSSETDSLQIAWRYQNMPKVQGSVSSKFGHYYDLTKTMPAEQVQQTDKTLFDFTEMSDLLTNDSPTRYIALLQSVRDVIHRGQFSTSSSPEKRNILRIGIHSLGSALWGENGGVYPTGAGHDPALLRFLLALRSLLRSSYAVCFLTIPTHLFQAPSFTWRVEKLCDTVVSLQSFAGSDKEKNPVYKEYHGLFHIRSLPRLNSLNSHTLDTMDWAFKLKRKKFMIEKLHLPPELSETSSRAQEDPVGRPGCGGGSTGKNKLDF